MQIREAGPENAGPIIGLFERLYAETSFLLSEQGEMVPSAEDCARRVSEARKAESGVVYLAHADNELVGILFGNRGTARRNRHFLFLVMGVLQAHWNRAIGTSLIESAAYRAKAKGLHRLELAVQKRNVRAIALYKKAGFEAEGLKRHSLANRK